jgi:hypothetical protein
MNLFVVFLAWLSFVYADEACVRQCELECFEPTERSSHRRKLLDFESLDVTAMLAAVYDDMLRGFEDIKNATAISYAQSEDTRQKLLDDATLKATEAQETAAANADGLHSAISSGLGSVVTTVLVGLLSSLGGMVFILVGSSILKKVGCSLFCRCCKQKSI